MKTELFDLKAENGVLPGWTDHRQLLQVDRVARLTAEQAGQIEQYVLSALGYYN
ncbi:hypothetical protein ES707_10687 [subsurface metagenome]